MELQEALAYHSKVYPLMQPADYYKLVYQNEFGGGHMIADAQRSLAFLLEEARALSGAASTALSDGIGAGLCRMHLAGALTRGLSPQTLNRMFVATANTHSGTRAGFEDKLLILSNFCKGNILHSDPAAMSSYIDMQRKLAFPAVHHSDVYARTYHPAYRVVHEAYARCFALFCRIDALLAHVSAPIIAIDGRSASGKSTLAEHLHAVYGACVIHMDDFFLPPAKRKASRLAEPGGNVDYERFKAEVLAPLNTRRPFSYRIFDCKKMDFAGERAIDPRAPVVIEGAYSLRPDFGRYYDLSVFCSISPDFQKKRILARNGQEMLERFLSAWIPLEERYFSAFSIEAGCALSFQAKTADTTDA